MTVLLRPGSNRLPSADRHISVDMLNDAVKRIFTFEGSRTFLAISGLCAILVSCVTQATDVMATVSRIS